MAKPPAFQFYPNDFMDATRFWPANAVGLYIRLLCVQWTHGALPKELYVIAQGIGCTVTELHGCWNLIGPKFKETPEGLVNERLEEVRARQAHISSLRSAANKSRTNLSTNASTKKQQRKGKEKEKEKEEGEGEGTEGGPGETTRSDKRDPRINDLLEYLTAALRSAGIAQSLDVDRLPHGADGNRAAAKHILAKIAKDYPDADATEAAHRLIDIATQHTFHGPKCTKAAYIYRHMGTIIAEGRQQIHQRITKPKTDDEYLASIDHARREYEARRANGEVL